jgi:hypothetical protein
MAARKKATKKPAARNSRRSPTSKGGKPTKGKKGMPAFEPTDDQRKQVELLVGLGLTYVEIATVIINPRTNRGISTTTLQQRFEKELAEGQAKVKARVVGSLVQRAVDHSHPQGATCAIFLAKTRYGYKETQVVEHENAGVLVAPAAVTPEEWIAAQEEANEGRKSPVEE